MRGGLHEAEPTTSNLRDVHWAVQKKQHTWASMHLLNSSPSGTEQPVNFRTRHHQSAHQLTKIKRKPNSTNWCEKKKKAKFAILYHCQGQGWDTAASARAPAPCSHRSLSPEWAAPLFALLGQVSRNPSNQLNHQKLIKNTKTFPQSSQ